MRTAVVTLGVLLALIPACADQRADDDAASDPTPPIDDDVGAGGELAADQPAMSDTYDDPCESGVFFHYQLTAGRRNIPFPSDFFTYHDPTSSTGRRVYLGAQVVTYLDELLATFTMLTPAWNRLDGFGVTTATLFSADAAPDPDSLPDATAPGLADSVFCVELDPEAGEAVFWPLDFEWQARYHIFKARPRVPLRQNRMYAVVVTDQLRTKHGRCYQAAPHFRYVRSAVADGAYPQAEMLEPYRQRVAPYFELLEERVGIDRHRIVAATFFTTQNVTHDVEIMRDALADRAATAPPAIKEMSYLGTWDNLDSAWDVKYDTINWLWDGQLEYNDWAEPRPSGVEEVTARLTLPNPELTPQPYPVLIFLHGVNASRTSVNSIAHHFADAGFACLAMDLLYHGSRGEEYDSVTRALAVFNAFAPLKWRAGFQQMAADGLWLGHLVRGLAELDLAPYATGGDGIPDLDVEHIALLGHSLGTMPGGVLASVDDQVPVYVFNAGAADYRLISLESPNGAIVFDVVRLLQMLAGNEVADLALLLLDVIFPIAELGDPEAYAPYALQQPLPELTDSPRQIFQQMAAYDDTLGGPACGRMALSIGLTQLEPIVWPVEGLPTAIAPFTGPAVYQYDTSVHGMLWSVPEVGAQAAHFLRTWYETGVGEIVDPYATPMSQ